MSAAFAGATRINGDIERLFGGGYGACACDPISGAVAFKYSDDGITWGSETSVGTITSDPYSVNIVQQTNVSAGTITITNGLQIWVSTNYGQNLESDLMAIRTTPELRVNAYPHTAIPKRTQSPVYIVDILGNAVNLGIGDGTGVDVLGPGASATDPTVAGTWFGTALTVPFTQPKYVALTNVEFMRFLPDGTVSVGATPGEGDPKYLAFWYINPRLAFLDCLISGTTLTAGNTALHWNGNNGTWKSAKDPQSPQRIWIFNSGDDVLATASTVGNLPANRCIFHEVKFTGSGVNGPNPAYMFTWGDGSIGIRAEQGKPFCVYTLQNGKLQSWRQIPGAGTCDLTKGHYYFNIMRFGGYFVVSINNQSFWFMTTTNIATGASTPQAVQTDWPAGKLNVNCWNVKALSSTGVLVWDTSDDSNTPLTGTVAKFYPYNDALPTDPPPGYPGGRWAGPKPVVTVSYLNGGILASVALTASADGIESPILNKISIISPPVWNAPSISPIDISIAVTHASLTLGHPPEVPGAELIVNLDRSILDGNFNTSGVPNWGPYCDRKCPIEFSMRWWYDDGTHGDWRLLFKGYITVNTKSTQGANTNTMSLTCYDPVMRLQGNNARINRRYGPLDLLFIQAANSGGSSVYGSDCVQYILRTALGQTIASSLLTYFGTGYGAQYPIWSADTDVCSYLNLAPFIPIRNGIQFPPPWKQDALYWINQIANDIDKAVFFFGWPVGAAADDWPVPIYGRLATIVLAHDANGTLLIPDRVYISPDDIDLLMQGAETSVRQVDDINMVEVLSNLGDQTMLQDYVPAVIIGADRLDAGDRNAPELTWESDLMIDESLGAYPGGAQSIATSLIYVLQNRDPQTPKVTFKMQEQLQPFDSLQFEQVYSDAAGIATDRSLGIAYDSITGDPIIYRAQKIRHDFNMSEIGPAMALTTAWARPKNPQTGW